MLNYSSNFQLYRAYPDGKSKLLETCFPLWVTIKFLLNDFLTKFLIKSKQNHTLHLYKQWLIMHKIRKKQLARKTKNYTTVPNILIISFHHKWKEAWLLVINWYIRVALRTSEHNVSFEAKINNFFYFEEKLCSALKILKPLHP